MLQALPHLESYFFSVFLILSLALVVMNQQQHVFFFTDIMIDFMASHARGGHRYVSQSKKLEGIS